MTPIRSILAAAVLLSATPGIARTVVFSGRLWDVKASDDEPIGPGPNHFSDDRKAVFVDPDGALHLTVAKRGGHWWSTEIAGRESLGYGTYRFDVAPGATRISDNTVFGMFTYDLLPAENYREIDAELSRWGDGRAENLQCSVQPADAPDLFNRFAVTENTAGWIMEFHWAPGVFDCAVTDKATGKLVGSAHVTRGVPTPGNEKTRINLWQFRGKSPIGGIASEVVVRNFTFTPQ